MQVAVFSIPVGQSWPPPWPNPCGDDDNGGGGDDLKRHYTYAYSVVHHWDYFLDVRGVGWGEVCTLGEAGT